MKKLVIVLGLVVAGVCLWLAFRGISFAETLESLKAAKVEWIALAMGVYTIGYLLRCVRWRLLLSPVTEIKAKDLFGPMMLGWFANNILPLRMGEIARAYIAGRKFKVSVSATLATILLERLCDTLAFLTTFLLAAIFFPFPHFVEKGAAALGTLCVLVIISLVIISNHLQRFHHVLQKLPLIPDTFKKKLMDIVTNFSHGVSIMKSGRHVVASLALSLLVWTMEGTVLYLFGRAFDIPLTYPASFFVLFFLGLSVTLPQAPGYVGTVEYFGVSALVLLGIPKSQGLPVILALHASQFLYIGIAGVWALWNEGLTFGSILDIEKKAEAETVT